MGLIVPFAAGQSESTRPRRGSERRSVDVVLGGWTDRVITPYRGRGKPASQKDANKAHARLRAPSERASAQLKTWQILRKLRCCPWRAGHLAKAIHVLQTHETTG